MTSRVLAYGNNAAGVLAYLTHDRAAPGEPHPQSDRRVAGIAMRGMPLDDGASVQERVRTIYLCGRIIQNNISDAAHLKRLAGVSARGRKLKHGLVHVGLSWPDDERPSWEEMQAAGDSWLEAQGLDGNRTVLVAHVEEGLPYHVHLVSCLVNPENGRAYRGNLALGGSSWAERYEREHGGIRIQTRVERNRLRAEARALKKEAREAEERAGLGDKALSLIGASRAQRLERQVEKRKAAMPATEPTRSAGLHRQRADEGHKPIWHQLLTAQENEFQALAEQAPTQEQRKHLALEQRLARTELRERLRKGEAVENPPSRVLAPMRYRAASANDPAGRGETAWFREHAPDSQHGRMLQRTGYTPSRLVETLGPELGARWAEAMRQHIAREPAPRRLRALLEPGGNAAAHELKQVWFEEHEPSEAVLDRLLAARQTPRLIEEKLGAVAGPGWAEAMAQQIARRPRPQDLSPLFDAETDPIERELKLEWCRRHEPGVADAEALLTAGGTLRHIEEALGPEAAPWVQAAERSLADGPPPDTPKLVAALAVPARREQEMVWFRLNEPTEAKLRAVVASGTDPRLLDAVLKGASPRAADRELARKWAPAVFRQYVAEFGSAGVFQRQDGWDGQLRDWEKLAYPPPATRTQPAPTAREAVAWPRERAAAAPLPAAALPVPSEQHATPCQAWPLPQAATPMVPAAAPWKPKPQTRRRPEVAPASPPAPTSAATPLAPAGSATSRQPSPGPTPARQTRETATPPGREVPARPAAAVPVASAESVTPAPVAPSAPMADAGPPRPRPAREPEPAQTSTPESIPITPPRRPAGDPPTDEDLIDDLRARRRAGSAWFWTHRPDEKNVRAVVANAVDPELIAHVLTPELAQGWVPPLEEAWGAVRRRNPRAMERLGAAWEQERLGWRPLPPPPGPSPPAGPLAGRANELLRVLPGGGERLWLSDHRALKEGIDKHAAEPEAKELALKLVDCVQASNPYAPWQREDETSRAMATAEAEYKALPRRKRRQTNLPDREAVLTTILRELVDIIVQFCRRALGLAPALKEHGRAHPDTKLPPASRPPAAPSPEQTRKPGRSR